MENGTVLGAGYSKGEGVGGSGTGVRAVRSGLVWQVRNSSGLEFHNTTYRS